MNKRTKINIGLSIVVFLLIWVPLTRLYLISYAFADYAIMLLSLILIISSMKALQRNKSWIHIVTFMIGFSPLIFIIISLISYKINPAP